MAHWKLKIEKQFADEIVSGMKNFEIRCENDKIFQKGDSVEFLMNSSQLYVAGEPGAFYATKEDHPIYGRIYEITYVLHGWGLREDYCAFAIKERVNEETAEPKEDIVLRPAGFDVKEFTYTLRRNVARDIRKMCADRPNCAGCIFSTGIYEDTCELKGLPGEWLI